MLVCCLYYSRPGRCEAVSLSAFDVPLPNDLFFGERFMYVLCPYFSGLLSLVLSVGVIHIFWILNPHQIHDLQTFSPIL